jgi:hypothetical protein
MFFLRNDTIRVRLGAAFILLITMVLVFAGFSSAAVRSTRRSTINHERHHHHKVVREGAWAGAGFAAGRAVGPAGSAAVGVTKYRKDLKAGGHRRTRAIAKISGPIAAGAVAGPAGSAAYAAVEHRNWIKRHIFHQKQHG